MSDTNFMRSLVEFDKDNISDTVIHKLKKYIDNPDYQPNVVAKQSRAAMSLCMWTRAMDVYNRCGLPQTLCRVLLRRELPGRTRAPVLLGILDEPYLQSTAVL